jgi:glutamate formiminotransferase/formiminotetrahydrofolate cyclodeaminase
LKIIECIPNFSEGANQETLAKIAHAIKSTENVKLLHQDSGKAANRTVFTYAGEMEAVFEATYRAIQVATETIDMQTQKGEHPRIGACDVCPFVPISGITMDELITKVQAFAGKVAKELNIPIFLYEESASNEMRRNLANHRVGGYDALENRINFNKWLPDFGKFSAKTGGTVMGARNFLIAYNINLSTKDAAIAQEIAFDLRELGRPLLNEDGRKTYQPGKLEKVKAIGWYIEDFQIAQVSINLTDYKTTSLHKVFETTKLLANNYGVKVTGSELIGLIPKDALLATGMIYANNNALDDQEYIDLAVDKLGLSELVPFKPNLRVLEYVMNA